METSESKLIKALAPIEKSGFTVQKKISEDRTVYLIRANANIKITLEKKWISLDFQLENSKIFYSINSDVYDITKPEHKEFTDEVATDIVNFLKNLASGRIKIAHNKNRPLLLIPASDGVVLLKEGRFLASATELKSPKDIESKYNFTPFELSK